MFADYIENKDDVIHKVAEFYDCDLDGMTCFLDEMHLSLDYDNVNNKRFHFRVKEMTQHQIEQLPEWNG